MRDWWNYSYLHIKQSIWTTEELLYGHSHILLEKSGNKIWFGNSMWPILFSFPAHLNYSMYLHKRTQCIQDSTSCCYTVSTVLTHPSEQHSCGETQIINAVSHTLQMFHSSSCRTCNSTTIARSVWIVGVLLQVRLKHLARFKTLHRPGIIHIIWSRLISKAPYTEVSVRTTGRHSWM